jgi:electron transport complex protein RnfB
MDESIYEELARHLDQHVVGMPTSPAAIGILEVLYPGEQAEVAVKLTFEPKTVEQWREAIPEKAAVLDELLPLMAKRGTVYTEQKPGEERVYRLLPTIVGISETPFFAGVPDETTRALAPLWIQYFTEKYGEELERGVPLVRVVPISDSLADESEVLPYDALKDRVMEATFISIAHCPCRQMRRAVGEGCEHELENCLHFGSMGRYMVEQGMARRLTGAEAVELLQRANVEGLVHVSDNINGMLSTVCNCCPCCCAFLTTSQKMGRNSLSRSSYVASVSADCVGCGACEDRCPVGAVTVGDEGVAVVEEAVCIGCGVCAPTCATETLALIRRAEPQAPPEPIEFVQARLKK